MVLYFGNITALLVFENLAFSTPSDVVEKRLSTLVNCLKAKSVPVIESVSPAYSDEVLPYNFRVPFFPQAVAIPETADQVSSALICAQSCDVQVAARSGGHSYAGFGLGGKNGSLMIDMKKFKSVVVDQDTKIATIGSGTRLGDMAHDLFNQGGRALPHGLCPGVGIGGHALHGGFGMASRMWGITLDTILEMEVVLPNGAITTASKTQNQDLFWALRGAGDSFGIVTKFKFQTLEAPENGVLFTYSFGKPTTGSAVSCKVSIFNAVQEYAQTTAPKELALRLWVFNETFEITGVYWGSKADFDIVIAPLLAKWPNETTVNIEEHTWLDMLVSLANGQSLPQAENYTQHDTFFAKSLVAPGPLTSNALTSLFSYYESNENAPVVWWVIGDLYGGVHSNISSFSLSSASYAVRDSLFTYQFYSYSESPNRLPPYPPGGIEFMNNLVRSITAAQPQTKFAAYPNYVDPTLSASEAHALYYGSQYPKLLSIKKAVDPKMTLWNPQAVGV